MKWNAYSKSNIKPWFWRNKAQAEIDYVEESKVGFSAFELKWNDKKTSKFSASFTDFYQPENTHIIHKSNFWNHLGTLVK